MTSTDQCHGFSLSFLLFSERLIANRSVVRGEGIVRVLSKIRKRTY
jgi:hypothetical protein